MSHTCICACVRARVLTCVHVCVNKAKAPYLGFSLTPYLCITYIQAHSTEFYHVGLSVCFYVRK